ncbi:MAG: methyltransferase [Acidobacteriota bacterium]
MSTEPGPPPHAQLFDLIWPAGLVAQAVRTAAELGLADRLVEGPKTVAALAEATDADPTSLRRLLTALVAVGVFREDEQGLHQTPVSETLLTDRPDSTAPWARFLGAPFLWDSWGALADGVRNGRTAFEQVHGRSFYEHVAENPGDATLYDQAMNAGSHESATAVLATHDFSRYGHVVDVGGGRGALLSAILTEHAGMKGTLVDFPSVVAEASEALRSGELASRCTIVGADAREGVPSGGDAYLLKSVVHSLDDDQASIVLRHCRDALSPDGRVLLVELVRSDDGPPGRQAALMDLLMMTLVPGRERTRKEFERLLASSGLELVAVHETQAHGNAVIEAKPARSSGS